MQDSKEEVIEVEIKETAEPEVKKEATSDDIKINEKLLKANAKIANLKQELQEAQQRLQEKETAAKEEAFNSLLTKYKVKPEFHKFVKWELKWWELSDLDKAISDFVINNPALVETITTGGTPEEKKSNEFEKSENSLLKFKEENNR